MIAWFQLIAVVKRGLSANPHCSWCKILLHYHIDNTVKGPWNHSIIIDLQKIILIFYWYIRLFSGKKKICHSFSLVFSGLRNHLFSASLIPPWNSLPCKKRVLWSSGRFHSSEIVFLCRSSWTTTIKGEIFHSPAMGFCCFHCSLSLGLSYICVVLWVSSVKNT